MSFVFGEDAMLPKFEEALLGLSAGDSFTIEIPCDDAYGPEQENLFIEYPKSMFLEDGEIDEDMLQEGEVIPLESPEGDIIEGVVCEVKLNSVILDFNHPLAGEDLLFEGSVVSVD
jgi:FKBP-type peptidyl-prolyl cis-trans isomerase SlyD